MKTKLTFAALILCMVLSAQKKKNGNIYIEHPAMEVVDEFNTAFVTGDLEKIKSLVSDDFKWRNSTMREKPGTLKQLLMQVSNYGKLFPGKGIIETIS